MTETTAPVSASLLNQDPVEQYPDYYAKSAYRSTCIPLMPASSESEHGPEFISKHMTYGRFPWSKGSDRVCPVSGMKDQFDDLQFEDGKEGPDFWTHERIAVMTTNRLANIVGMIHFISLMCLIAFFAFAAVVVIALVKFGLNGFLEMYPLPLYFLVGYFVLNKGVKLFVAKKNHLFLKEDSGLYRRTGMVRVRRKGQLFEAPFHEFDAWLNYVHIGNGGRSPILTIVHRYQEVAFKMSSGFLTGCDEKEVYSVWLVLQRYMDVSQPLPDLPIFEPYRELDPVTAEFDRRTGRDPRRWRNSTYEQWKAAGEEKALQQRLWALNYHIADMMEPYVMDRSPRSPQSRPEPETLAVREF